MKGTEKESHEFGRGDYVELDPSHSSRPLPVVRIDGPYGAPAEDVFKVEVAVLRTKLEMVEAQLTRERELREQERESAERERDTTRETVADLRKRLDRAEERVLALSAPPSQPPAPAAAVVEPVAPAPLVAPKPPAGFLARLFGRG